MKRAAILLTTLSLLAAACGGNDEPAAGVPSLEGRDPGAASSTTEARLDADLALLEFSKCMRDQGIPLPDIALGADGAPILDPALLETIDVQSDEFTDAFEKCQPILSQSEAFSLDLDPQLQALIEDQFFAFSQCMRDNGFEDFPDPSSLDSGPVYPLSILARISEPEFEAAIEICQRDLAFPGFDG
jgi:hypothetical protein